MNKKSAALWFLGICVLLAILLITKVIDAIVSGIIFAIALVVFGGLSHGFRKTT